MKLKYLFLSLLTVALATSCKDKKQEANIDTYIRPASMDFTKEDTTAIMTQLDNYVAAIKAKDYSSAVANLYVLQGRDSVLPLTQSQRQHAMEVYNHFNIYDCAVNAFMLKGESENMVKVALQIVKDGDMQKGIGVTYVKLRPVKHNDNWYLTIMDNDQLRIEEER